MQEYKIPLSNGLWVSIGNSAPDGFANELINLIPTQTGLVLRKGHQKLENIKGNYIASFVSSNCFIVFSKELGIQKLTSNNFVELIAADKEIPIQHIETNNRLILFYKNAKPKELFYNSTTKQWSFTEVALDKLEETKDEDYYFSNSARYKERLFYYKQGSNILYYTDPIAYKGKLKTFDVTSIFNSKGTIIFVDVLGYSSGGGVSSNLVVGLDSGDILVFDGTNPESAENWKAITVISTGSQLYSKTIRLGTKLLALTNEGLIDIGTTISQDNIIEAKSICKPIIDANIDYSNVKLHLYGSYLLINLSNSTQNYLFNLEVGAFCNITSDTIITSLDSLQNNLYFCDINGEIYKGFSSVDDSGKPIVGKFSTTFLDFGISNNKLSQFVNMSLLNTSDANVYCNVNTNNLVNYNNPISLPKQGGGLRWSQIPTWVEARNLFKSVGYQYTNIKAPRGGLGRTLCISMLIKAKKIKDFKIYGCSLLFETLQY